MWLWLWLCGSKEWKGWVMLLWSKVFVVKLVVCNRWFCCVVKRFEK